MVHHHVICVFKSLSLCMLCFASFVYLVMNAHVYVHICVTVHISNLYSPINYANNEISIYIIFTEDKHIKAHNSTLVSNVARQKILRINLSKYKK